MTTRSNQDPAPPRSSLVPAPFDPLEGIRILSTGSLIAQPFGATLAAEMGAEVIQVERPGEGDIGWRHLGVELPRKDGPGKIGTSWIQERRNSFYVTLDFARPEGRELFFRLVRVCDIWMESSKPGSYAEWGLTDEVVLAGNPKLVIAHVSGYGQSGHPDYLGRASYDMVGHPPREGTHVPRVRRVWRRHPLGSLPLLRLWEEGEGLRRAQTTRLIAAVVGHESRPRSSVATKKACLTRPTPALLFVDYHLSEIRVRLLRSGG